MNRSTRRSAVPTVLVSAFVALVAACGSSDAPASGDGTALSDAAERGRRISTSNGCASCHGVDGEGGVGPPWVGLAGSEVELADGTMVVADDEYLVRAIVDPAADLRAGYAVQMPANRLGDGEVDDLIAYIKALGPPPADG